MTVVHMRIDNRLIHGQVTASWANAIHTNRLIVTNDQVARDSIQQMLLPQLAIRLRCREQSSKWSRIQ
jgi:PTS system mannose-specific IIB component